MPHPFFYVNFCVSSCLAPNRYVIKEEIDFFFVNIFIPSCLASNKHVIKEKTDI